MQVRDVGAVGCARLVVGTIVGRMRMCMFVLCALAAAAAPSEAWADSRTEAVIYNFDAAPIDSADGAYPYGTGSMILGSDGNLYGTTSSGGTSGDGTLFKLTPDGQLATLCSISAGLGTPIGPNSLVQASDGSFLGTSIAGGTDGVGTVFRIAPDCGVATLHSFSGAPTYLEGVVITALSGIDIAVPLEIHNDPSMRTAQFVTSPPVSGDGTITIGTPPPPPPPPPVEGARPYGLTLGSDGNLYGAGTGGTNGLGTLFRLSADLTMTILYDFGAANTSTPQTNLFPNNLVSGGAGNLYGIAPDGSVFGLPPTGALTALDGADSIDSCIHITAMGSDGNLVPAQDGSLYGVTSAGEFFNIAQDGTRTSLYSFGCSSSDYDHVAGLLLGTDGNFYGTTSFGGANKRGSVFKLTPSGVETTLHSFSGDDGQMPFAGLVQGRDGNFYGTTNSGGKYFAGTAYKITPLGELTTLHDFRGLPRTTPSAPTNSVNNLVQTADGILFGTSFEDGEHQAGTFFKLAPDGSRTTLHNFGSSMSDGRNPNAGLILGKDGNFYGTTASGGGYGSGTVFNVSADGTLSILHNFGETIGDGATPDFGLVAGLDGSFYGTTKAGGSNGGGTVFNVTTDGTLQILYSFQQLISMPGEISAISLGATKLLTQGPDGTLYGTTPTGTIFSLASDGSFNSIDSGFLPNALIVTSDGNLVGTAGGIADGGSIFKVSPSGSLIWSAAFPGQSITLAGSGTMSGYDPSGALLQASDGHIYGTTSGGGIYGSGTEFEVDANGNPVTLYSFGGSPTDAANPNSVLTEGNDGSLYGGADYGGANGSGAIFRIFGATATTVPPSTGPSANGGAMAFPVLLILLIGRIARLVKSAV